MDDICCTSCGYVAQYEDVSDGDFDVENSICYECSVARFFTHSADGRRFATRIGSTSLACGSTAFAAMASIISNPKSESHDAWNNAMNDGIVPCLRVICNPKSRFYEANAIKRQRSNAQYLFREIDLRGVGIQQQKLGYRKAQVKEFPQFVKSATSSAAIMCGGGGGSGGMM